MELQTFFTNNYDKLMSNITKVNKTTKHKLLTELYLNLDKKWQQFKDQPENDIIAYCARFTYNEYTWTNTQYNFDNKLNSVLFVDDPKYIDYRMESDAETDDPYIKDYIFDLLNNYTETEIQNIIKAKLVSSTFNRPEKILYEMYFTQRMSTRKIAAAVKLPHSTVYLMIKEMINKVKEGVK